MNMTNSKLSPFVVCPKIVGAVTLGIGLLVSVLGLEMLPNSIGWIVLTSGVLVDISGYFLTRRSRYGAWMYVIASAYTFLWAIWSSPLRPWDIFRNLWFIPVLGLFVAAITPLLLPQKNIAESAKVSAAVSVGIACVLAISLLHA